MASLLERRTLRGHTKLVKALAFSPDGRQVLSGSWDWSARVWDAGTGELVQTLAGHGSAIGAVAWLPGGRGVVTASWDRTARLWTGGAEPRVLEGHTDRLSSVAVAPDGSAVATASWDGSVILWDPATGQARSTIRSPGGRVQAVAFVPLFPR
jgi:WD40 repeat protein